MTEIENLIELCPCEVKFDSLSIHCVGGQGCYWATDQREWGSGIEIGYTDSESRKLYTLAHETGHALCDAKECKCGIGSDHHGDRTKSEYHAFKFCGEWLLKNKCKGALRYFVKSVGQLAVFNPQIDRPYLSAHTKACRKIKKLKLWEKCVEYAKSK